MNNVVLWLLSATVVFCLGALFGGAHEDEQTRLDRTASAAGVGTVAGIMLIGYLLGFLFR